jgi:anthranilate synthase
MDFEVPSTGDGSQSSAGPAVLKVESYLTEAGVHVTCCQADAGAVEPAVTALAEQLDARLGSMMLSDYETPGRYSKWMQGFVNPPVMVVSRGYSFELKALNERGQVLLLALRAPLKAHADLKDIVSSDTHIAGTVIQSEHRFPEEERSRQPSVFTVVRVIQQVGQTPG